MKEFAAFVVKEFQHIIRDKRTILIVIVMPVVQIILFGYAISTEINGVRVDVTGDMSDPSVRSLVQRIDNNRYMEVSGVLESEERIEERFRKGESDVAVCFGRDFGRHLTKDGRAEVKIVGDGSDPNTAQMMVNYVTGVIQSEQNDINAGQTGGKTSVPSVETRYMYNPAMESSYNFVPGVMGLILTLICSMMTAISIVREKETGTMELLLVSPVRPIWIIVSKVVPYLALSAVNFTTILLLSRFLMGVPMRGSLPLLCLTALIFMLASLALGLLISVAASTQKTSLLISGMGLMMPTMILSGIIFPCESMPPVLQYVSDVIPAKWFIIMVKKIMIEGMGFQYIVREFCILLGMAVVLLAVSVKLFRTRL